MLSRYLFACICITAVAACSPPASDNPENPTADPIMLTLHRGVDGNLEYCDASGSCQSLPYAGDCAIIETTLDTATGGTCQTCITDDGTRIDEGCTNNLVACVVVTLPNPDCVVCAYVNGAVIYSTCVAEPPRDCDTICIERPGVAVMPCASDADCLSGTCVAGICEVGPLPEPYCCEQCTDPYGRTAYDGCVPDCSTLMCTPVVCDPGYTRRRPPGECCDHCVPIEDCSQVVCPMIYPIPECPPGSILVQDPTDCCRYYCEPTECAIEPRPGSGAAGGGQPGVPFVGCASNQECSPGEICAGGACAALCNTASDCTRGAACVAGVCTYVSYSCASAADCEPGLICRNGVCMSDCPPGYHVEARHPSCGQCVPDATGPSCYSDTDCAAHEYCAYDNCAAPGGDPNFIPCQGVCRPRTVICDSARPVPPYCEGWIETRYDAGGCAYFVCVCPDGTVSLDGACADHCENTYCPQVLRECAPGHHFDYALPYCCGHCVPDSVCDATAPTPNCAVVECAAGYHKEIDPRTCCPTCVPDAHACLSNAECAAGQVCDSTQCNPPPACDPASEACFPVCYGGCVPAECSPEECGPSPGLPNTLCPDGSVGGPTGRCLRNDTGTCGWEILACPSGACYDSDGADPYTAGSATRSTPNSSASCADHCSADGSAVIECICTTDGNLVTTSLRCDNGCGDGACLARMCGGIAGLPCPDGYLCIDDPRDSCDPRAGGADCSGICVR